jgi:hypothetical protein
MKQKKICAARFTAPGMTCILSRSRTRWHPKKTSWCTATRHADNKKITVFPGSDKDLYNRTGKTRKVRIRIMILVVQPEAKLRP